MLVVPVTTCRHTDSQKRKTVGSDEIKSRQPCQVVVPQMPTRRSGNLIRNHTHTHSQVREVFVNRLLHFENISTFS